MGEADLSKLKVLVADDEPKLRALVTKCVQALGCEVIEASDGDEAWQLADRESPDVVVLDVMMPGMSGWDVCRRIKSSATTSRGARPKVLMLTGIGEHLNEMTSPLFAADDWINKPFDLDVLRDKVAELGRDSLEEPGLQGPSLRKARPSEVGSVVVEPLSDDDESVVDVTGEPVAFGALEHGRPSSDAGLAFVDTSPAAEAAGATAREARASSPPPAAAGARRKGDKAARKEARAVKKAEKTAKKNAKKAAKVAKKASDGKAKTTAARIVKKGTAAAKKVRTTVEKVAKKAKRSAAKTAAAVAKATKKAKKAAAKASKVAAKKAAKAGKPAKKAPAKGVAKKAPGAKKAAKKAAKPVTKKAAAKKAAKPATKKGAKKAAKPATKKGAAAKKKAAKKAAQRPGGAKGTARRATKRAASKK